MSHWAEEEEWWDCLISERGDVRSIFYTSLSSEQHFIGEEEIFWLKWHQQLINFRSPQNFTWATDIKLIHLIFIFKVFICNIEIRFTSETITLYDLQNTQWWSTFIRQILQALPTHLTFTKLINPPATKVFLWVQRYHYWNQMDAIKQKYLFALKIGNLKDTESCQSWIFHHPHTLTF